MEPTHEFKPVHDPLFCEEGDIPAILPNPEEKDFFKNVHLVNSYGNEFRTAEDKFYNPGDIPACDSENSCEIIQEFLKDDDDDSFSIYRAARREYQDAMTTCENKIEQYKQDIRTEIQEIYIHQQRYDEALKTYLK
jgi:hypothetical protein